MPKTFPSPTLPATPPRRGLGRVLAPATSSAIGTHFQVPLHSGGQLQRSPGPTGGPGLNGKDSWSCTLWGEADPSSRLLVASPLSHLRKHLTQAWLPRRRNASLGKRECDRVGEALDPSHLWLLSQSHHVSESPFPFLWDDNKIISILPCRAVLKAQRTKCTDSTLKSVNWCHQEPPPCPWLDVQFQAWCPSAGVERGLEERKRPGSGMSQEGGKWVLEKEGNRMVRYVGSEPRGAWV